MKHSTIKAAIDEALRFLSKARAARDRLDKEPGAVYGCKETAALRRSSMDLSRSLSELRRR